MLQSPFCGGTGQYETTSGNTSRVAYVKCIRCHAQIARVPVSDEYCAKDEAIKAWNRRAVREKGEWIPQDNTYTRYMCSVCEAKNYGGHEKYCPNCGADMRKGGADV